MSGERNDDARIADAQAELRRLKEDLGEAYWQDETVIALQQDHTVLGVTAHALHCPEYGGGG